MKRTLVIEGTTHGKTESLFKELQQMNLQVRRTGAGGIVINPRDESEYNRVVQMCDTYDFVCHTEYEPEKKEKTG